MMPKPWVIRVTLSMEFRRDGYRGVSAARRIRGVFPGQGRGPSQPESMAAVSNFAQFSPLWGCSVGVEIVPTPTPFDGKMLTGGLAALVGLAFSGSRGEFSGRLMRLVVSSSWHPS